MSQAATDQDTVRGHVDLHAHVLPGIDDGPADTDGALAMLRAACAAGIGTIAVTPHLRSDFPDVRVGEMAPRAQQLREAGEMAGIDIRIISGAEVSLMWALEASDEQLALATYDQGGHRPADRDADIQRDWPREPPLPAAREGASGDARPPGAQCRLPARSRAPRRAGPAGGAASGER